MEVLDAEQEQKSTDLPYLLVGPGRYIVPISRTLEILITPPY